MHRIEKIALRSTTIRWDRLVDLLPPTLESVGLVPDDAASDGAVTVKDHGESGCVIVLEDLKLSRRVAVALARSSGVPLELFEVVGTSGGKRMRFRTTAFKATPAGELRDAEGKELPLDDEAETFGGGDLADRADRVLELFGTLDGIPERTLQIGYKRRPGGRPSTPRVATLLASLQKARSHEAFPQPDGRIELRIALAAGGRQTSFCTAAEHEELERLLVGKRG